METVIHFTKKYALLYVKDYALLVFHNVMRKPTFRVDNGVVALLHLV